MPGDLIYNVIYFHLKNFKYKSILRNGRNLEAADSARDKPINYLPTIICQTVQGGREGHSEVAAVHCPRFSAVQGWQVPAEHHCTR